MLKPASSNNLRLVCASVITLALAACGGGGGGGGGIAVIPPPPPPPPTPAAFSISAPARATTGSGPAPVFASQDGPNFTSGPGAGTRFPLLQTVLLWDTTAIQADTSANAAGGTATFELGQLKIDLPNTFSGVPQSGSASLDWTRVGYWGVDLSPWDYGYASRGVFVTGYETPASAVPATGTATYTGLAQGTVFYPVDQGASEVQVLGDASFTANFGTRNLSGSLTNMQAQHPWDETQIIPWNDVAFNSTIIGNGFSGTTAVTSAPPNWASMAPNATGTIEGKFFGPSAQEAGAVWTLFDGAKSAIGTLSGRQR